MTTTPEAGTGGGQRRSWKLRPGLGGRILIGFVLGIAVGIFFGEMASVLQVLGDAFIMLMQIAVIPYIVVSLITALGQLSFENAKKLALKAGGVVLVLWAIGIAILLLTPLAFPDWQSASFFSTSLVEEPKPVDFLRLYIPANPFASLAEGAVPAIVIFSVLIGVSLIGVKNKQSLLDPLSAVADALMVVTGFVARLAPYGTFALTASAAGTFDIEELDRLQVYLVLYVTMALILTFWVMPALVTVLTPLRYAEVIGAMRGAMLTAFASGSVLIVLPLMAAECRRLTEEKTTNSRDGSEARSSVDVILPAVYNVPGLGNIMALMFVLFAGWYIGAPVSVSDYPLLVGAGLASMFGGSLLAIPFLLDLLRLPQDLFEVFLTVDVIGRRFSTLAAVMGMATTALIGATAMQGRLRIRRRALLRFVGITAGVLACALVGIRMFYSQVVVAPYTRDEALRALHLLADPQPATVYRDIPAAFEAAAGGPADIAEVRARGVLRACYLEDEFPSSFFNAEGQLVGFNIELVHRLARSLDLPIEFLPVKGEDRREAARLLAAGVCDLHASTMAVSAQRMEEFTMTIPIYTGSVGLIVPDHMRDEFPEWGVIQAQGAAARIAVPGDAEVIRFLRSMLPDATLLPLATVEEKRRLLEAGAPEVDAILSLSEEGAAWALLYPRFSLVVPKPVVFTPQGFGVARGNISLAQTIDAWIIEEKARGTVDIVYRYWMLGEAVRTERPPRWSVIRNVLGWSD